MESLLLNWIEEKSGIISRKEVQKKAKLFSKDPNFKASKGWFERFYKRNKIYLNDYIEILTNSDYRRRLKEKESSPAQTKTENEFYKENQMGLSNSPDSEEDIENFRVKEEESDN